MGGQKRNAPRGVWRASDLGCQRRYAFCQEHLPPAGNQPGLKRRPTKRYSQRRSKGGRRATLRDCESARLPCAFAMLASRHCVLYRATHCTGNLRFGLLGMNESVYKSAAANRGASHTAKELLPLVYEELRRLASAKLARERPGQTLQPTALVHEAWLRLGGSTGERWEGRTHSSVPPHRPCGG